MKRFLIVLLCACGLGMSRPVVQQSSQFTPRNLPGVQLWLSGISLGGIAVSNTIATWPDLSDHLNSATNATGAQQPLTASSPVYAGNRTCVWFDGSDDNLITPSFLTASYNTNATMAWVVSQRALGLHIFAGHNVQRLYMGHTGVSSGQRLFTHNGLSQLQLAYTDTTCLSPASVSWNYNGGDEYVRVNFASVNTNAVTGNLQWNGTLTVGQYTSGGFNWNGNMWELIVVNGNLTPDQTHRLEMWLGYYYGMQTSTLLDFDGDSLTVGTGGTAGHDYPTLVYNALGQKWQFANNATPGDFISTLLATKCNNLDDPLFNHLRPKGIIMIWAGTNDLATNLRSGADTYADFAACCSARRAIGWKVVALNMLPRSNVGLRADFNTERAVFNGSVAANWTTFADALADVAANPNIGPDGASDDPTYYAGDKVHLNDTGYAIVAGIVTPLIQALP